MLFFKKNWRCCLKRRPRKAHLLMYLFSPPLDAGLSIGNFSILFMRTTKHFEHGVAQWLRRCATSPTIQGSIPGGVTWDFFRGSFRQNHVPWGRLGLWIRVPGISPGVKAAGAYGWRTTALVVPNVEMIRALNLSGTPRATSACRGTPLLHILVYMHLLAQTISNEQYKYIIYLYEFVGTNNK